jgi:hypothetical protein
VKEGFTVNLLLRRSDVELVTTALVAASLSCLVQKARTVKEEFL